MSVSHEELHTPTNDPSTLNIAEGVTLTDAQRKQVAVVLDLFQAKGTMSKVNDNFDEKCVYEDDFAKTGGREQLAGQLLHLPTVLSGTKTNYYKVDSVTPTTTTNSDGESIKADEITVAFDHELIFNVPLPKGAKTMHLDTNLHIFSIPSGKIVRLQDQSKEAIEEKSLPNFMRKFNAVVAPRILGLPANEKEDAEKVLSQQRD